MFLSVTYLDDGSTPFVYSIPPRKDPDGSTQPAQVTILPFGSDLDPAKPKPDLATYKPDKGSTTLTLSVEEAEELALQLVTVVQAAKSGHYSALGEELNAHRRSEGFRKAWEVLMSETPDD
jgi:hypothetical protein